MFEATIGAVSLFLLLGGVRADTAAPPADAAPQLQISRLSGRLEVRLDDRGVADARKLPFLPPGAVVRVLEGTATFDSDYHATVRAGQGDTFQFTVVEPEGSRSGALRVAAREGWPKALEVSVGDQKFRLKRGGSVLITAAWPGEMTVRSEGRGVQLAPGSIAKDGSILAGARRMASGETVTVVVPEIMGFDSDAINAGSMIVSKAKDGAVVVQAGRAAETAARLRDADARRFISVWPVVSQRTAEVILEKYGPPDVAIADRLVWYDNGAWKITTVYRDPREHLDVLEQTIGYTVPQEKMGAVASLDLALRLSRDNRALSAVSESEETNILALNLADEVIGGKKSPEAARAFYLKTVLQWNAGKSSPYMKELRFR